MQKMQLKQYCVQQKVDYKIVFNYLRRRKGVKSEYTLISKDILDRQIQKIKVRELEENFDKILSSPRRMSITRLLDEERIKAQGFEIAYNRCENAITNAVKVGDIAEEKAVEYLKNNNMLSDNFKVNQIISLEKIKIEADIIDYDKKVIYEVKSRTAPNFARNAIHKKIENFELCKGNSYYKDFSLQGVIYINTVEDGNIIKTEFHSIYKASKSSLKLDVAQERFNEHIKILAKKLRIRP